MAPTKDAVLKAFDTALGIYSAKYPKAIMACLEKDKEQMPVFHDFPAVRSGKSAKNLSVH